LAVRAREATNDGEELVAFYIKVFRGLLDADPQTAEGETKRVPQPVKLEHRLEAASWLADRGWGRPTQPINGQLGLTIEQVATLLQQQGSPASEQ